MSLSTVNTAIWNWLKPVNGLTVLHQAIPTYMLADQWQNNTVQGTPAYLHISDVDESRITVPAVNGGQKKRSYNVVIVCLYQWWIPNDLTNSPTGGPDGWVTGQLQLLDNIIARIEADPAFGTNGNPIFEAGNQDDGIRTHREGPVLDAQGGKVMAWCHVEFQVTEIVQA